MKIPNGIGKERLLSRLIEEHNMKNLINSINRKNEWNELRDRLINSLVETRSMLMTDYVLFGNGDGIYFAKRVKQPDGTYKVTILDTVFGE